MAKKNWPTRKDYAKSSGAVCVGTGKKKGRS